MKKKKQWYEDIEQFDSMVEVTDYLKEHDTIIDMIIEDGYEIVIKKI